MPVFNMAKKPAAAGTMAPSHLYTIYHSTPLSFATLAKWHCLYLFRVSQLCPYFFHNCFAKHPVTKDYLPRTEHGNILLAIEAKKPGV